MCYFFEVGSFQDASYRWSDRSKHLLHNCPKITQEWNCFFYSTAFHNLIFRAVNVFARKSLLLLSVLDLFWNTHTRYEYISPDFNATRDILDPTSKNCRLPEPANYGVDPVLPLAVSKSTHGRDIQRMLDCTPGIRCRWRWYSTPWHVKSLFLPENRKRGNEHVPGSGEVLSDADTFIPTRCYTCKLFVIWTRDSLTG